MDLHRMKAHFLGMAAIDIGAQRGRDHLRAKAHPQRRPVRGQAQRKAAHLAADPGMLDLVIDAHGATHHDQQVGLTQVERRERRIAHIDAIDGIAGLLDRLAIAGHPFVGHVADDQRGLHGSLS
jgi:hypothetical protein